ncbi:MAG: glycosyltransferase [Bacteroidetes bacterium]|nr:glycosyltransferase [Bacteroidota bacterium]
MSPMESVTRPAVTHAEREANTPLHVVHVFFGQVRKLSPLMAELRSLAGELRQTLIVPGYDQDPEYLAATLPDVDVRYVRMRSREWSARQTPLLKLLRFKEFTLRAMRELRRTDGDIFVAHDMPAMLPMLPRLLCHPERVIFHAHELWTEAAENLAPFRPFWRILERMTVRRAARVIVPEPNRARIVHEEYRSPRLPEIVMNIPADPPPFVRGTLLRERLSLHTDSVCVLYQGLLGETRCVLELVAAVERLPAHVHLVLIGLGEDSFMEKIGQAAERMRGRLHVFGWMHPEELRAFTASADMGVLLYRNSGRNNYYAAPNKLYEYLFAGLPVVSSAFPGLQTVVEVGGYGFCADPASPDDIARAITQAMTIAPGEELARRSRAAWRWSEQVVVLQRLYCEIAQQPHAL